MVDKIPDVIKRVKTRTAKSPDGFLAIAVYKTTHPAPSSCRSILCPRGVAETGHGDDPMLKVALESGEVAISDEYFTSGSSIRMRFLSGTSLEGDGIPTSMVTVHVFAVAAHRRWISGKWSDDGLRIRIRGNIGPPRSSNRQDASRLCRSHARVEKIGGN